MEIKGNSFIGNMMIAAAFSQIESESTKNKPLSLKKLEIKVIKLMDTILSKLSSSYQQSRAKVSNKIMLEHERQKFASVNRATEKVLPNTSESKEVKKEKKLEEVKELLEKTVEDLPDIFKINVNALNESSSEIEEKSREYQESKNLEALAEYLQKNPGVLAAFSYLYQEIESAQFAENFKELFGDMNVEALAETNSDIEEIAARYQQEKDQAEFNEDIANNLGSLAAALLFLQAYGPTLNMEQKEE